MPKVKVLSGGGPDRYVIRDADPMPNAPAPAKQAPSAGKVGPAEQVNPATGGPV